MLIKAHRLFSIDMKWLQKNFNDPWIMQMNLKSLSSSEIVRVSLYEIWRNWKKYVS